MDSKNQILNEAKQIISRRRERAIAKAQAVKADMYDRLPILIEYDNKIINCGIAAASLSAQNETAASKQKQQDLRNIEAERKKLITDNGFVFESLAPDYTCKLCKDTGRANGLPCICFKNAIKQLRREKINAASPLSLSDFEHFSLNKYSDKIDPEIGVSPKAAMENILAYCKSYAENFTKKYRSLLLMGDAGLGKTHLALSIANEVLDKGFDVIYVSAQDAFDKIEHEHFTNGDDSSTIAAMLETDLLILDDLGTEFNTAFTLSTIYNLVNSRINAQKPTVYTTNILSQKLLNARYTEKVTSRLLGSCEILHFFGDDIRLQNNN